VEDLKKNIELAVQMANYSIYIVVFFSGAMALVIISIVSNIVIDENKKHISLMKVMGYKEKEIKSVVLNIYTPFVIIAYLLSIPAMKAILRWIISLVAKDLDFSVPIVLSWQGALIGFAVIMVSYFLALQLSRRSLSKVPLAEALKRE
jgi:putative ABC transport system permease protein